MFYQSVFSLFERNSQLGFIRILILSPLYRILTLALHFIYNLKQFNKFIKKSINNYFPLGLIREKVQTSVFISNFFPTSDHTNRPMIGRVL